MNEPGKYERIFSIIKLIPNGKVATYGQIAMLAGIPGNARQVGYALSSLADDKIAWYRVVNSKGEISKRSESGFERIQQGLLEAEGVKFNKKGRILLKRYRWEPV